MESSARILVVDDEPRSIELLVRTLRRLGQVDSAPSGDAAWELAQRHKPDAVVSDQRMAGMQGVELLSRLSALDGRIGRVLITGYADITATIEAINQGRVHAYVTKPWQPEPLFLLVKQLLERARLERENERLLAELLDKNHALSAALADTQTAQRRAIDAERLAAIGRMSAMIAHDFRSPLSVVRAAAAELASEGATLPPAEIRALASSALDETERMARLCTDLLDATRASENRSEAMASEDLDAWIEGVVATALEDAGKRGIRVELGLAARASVRMDAERMRRALVNLFDNAVDAMPDGGQLRIETERDGATVRMRVIDSGVGIPASIEQRLFEPFVTAGKHHGTGLGLAVVKKVVEDHGGSIEVSKPPGGGCAFELRLPIGPAT
jgi:signal transduction histidine kinase